MGASTLQSIQYSGSGSSFTVGQAPGPGAPWPRFELAKYVATVNYAAPVMREETVRRDVDFPPRGGGAGPFIAATGQGGMRPIPGDVIQNVVRDGRNDAALVQIAMTPHGFLKVAASHKGRVNGRSVAVTIGKFSVTGVINAQELVESVETRLANNVLGDVPVRSVFSQYKDYGGVKFPSRIVQTQAGHPTLDLNVSDVQPNSAVARALSTPTSPPPAPPAAAKTEPQKIADGVWFL